MTGSKSSQMSDCLDPNSLLIKTQQSVDGNITELTDVLHIRDFTLGIFHIP